MPEAVATVVFGQWPLDWEAAASHCDAGVEFAKGQSGLWNMRSEVESGDWKVEGAGLNYACEVLVSKSHKLVARLE